MPTIRDGPKALKKPPALKKAKRPRFDEEPLVPTLPLQPAGPRPRPTIAAGIIRRGGQATARWIAGRGERAAGAISQLGQWEYQELGGRLPTYGPRFDTEGMPGARLGIANQVRFSGAGLPAWYVNRATNQAYQDWVMKRLIGAGLVDVPQVSGGGGGAGGGGGGGWGDGGGMEPASRLLGHAYGLINWRI